MTNFAEVIQKVSVPILVLDMDRIVLFANKPALDAFPTIQIGQGAQALWPKASGLKKILQKALKSDAEATTNLTTGSSSPREYKVTANILRLGWGEDSSAFILTFEDLTSLRVAKSMRSDFVANVSHEIRSPLTAISGFVESLRDSDDIDPETRNLFLGMMSKEVVRMTNLVADLLSLSKVEAKERRAVTKLVNIAQLLEQTHESVARLADERGSAIKLNMESDLPDVLGKHDDMLRVFINLAENAINYSSDGGIVAITAEIHGKDNPLRRRAICVSVSDQGDGIPAEEIPRLTERFYRVDKSRSRNVGGTGLGLAIVKHILVRHRGRLVIESTPGLGSKFSVFLPVKSKK